MPAVATAGGLPTRLGKYEILTPLAAGGMARIYIARTTGIGMFERHVVLKLITPERANDTIAVQMFLDEARLAAALNHQNVAQVFEVGEDSGTHYLAMEYVHGQDLRALLAKAGSQGTRVPLELALTVVAGAAAGLNHAHERRGPDGVPLGIVHRDVSPSNIMIGYDGSVKLLDFGIAKATARSVETQSGIIKGKFAYMAPEQCRGRDVDRRSDVFSLGIILYEVSTQHRCFRADSDFDTMHRIVTGDVVRPTRIVQGYPQALEAIVMKALAVDPSTRYQSASALLEAIESFAVSSRMALSTMSLGRFMRDMFGDAPEPWLTNSGGTAMPLEPKESTISNTNNTGGKAGKGLPARKAPPTEPDLGVGSDDPDDDEAAKTFLMSEDQLGDVAAASGVDVGDDEASGEGIDWNGPTDYDPDPATRPAKPKSHTATPKPHTATPPATAKPPASAAPLPTLIGTGRTAAPSSAARTSAVAPTATPVVSTRHGYASGNAATRGDAPYAKSESSAEVSVEASELHQLKPNRRPLFIGLAIAVVGLGVLLAMALGGGGESGAAKDEPLVIDPKPSTTPSMPPPKDEATDKVTDDKATSDTKPDDKRAPTIPETKPATPDQPAGTATGSAAGSEDGSAAGSATEPVATTAPTIEVEVSSEPAGAEVSLAGRVLGTTPLKLPLDKASGNGVLTIRKAGFLEATRTVDLRKDVTLRLLLKKVPAQTTTPKPKATGGGKPKQADCQQAGQYNGFDPRPICK